MALRRFRDRSDAGRRLAERLAGRLSPDTLVLGLPRGGVPVAAEAARAAGLPLDVLVVRKLGAPEQPELAIGAIATGEIQVLNADVLATVRDPNRAMHDALARELPELRRRELDYRGDRPPAPVAGRPVLIVDDGLATGATARVAVRAVRALGASRVDVAVPVGAPDVYATLAQDADDVLCLLQPDRLRGVGAWYDDFAQTTDEEVRRALQRVSSSAG